MALFAAPAIAGGLLQLLPTAVVLLLPADSVLLRRLLLQANALHVLLVQILLPRLLLQTDALHLLLVQVLLPRLLLQTDAVHLLPQVVLRWLRPDAALPAVLQWVELEVTMRRDARSKTQGVPPVGSSFFGGGLSFLASAAAFEAALLSITPTNSRPSVCQGSPPPFRPSSSL